MEDNAIERFQMMKHPSCLKNRKRKGRGVSAGQGHKCGRGQTGQQSRSGGHNHPRFEGGQMTLVMHLPKLDGFRSLKTFQTEVFNLETFNELSAGTEVNLSFMLENGLIHKTRGVRVKILGDGELTNALRFSAHAFSKTAREKIEAAGGTCEVVE
jgi:large subunit ribosomal protein L15